MQIICYNKRNAEKKSIWPNDPSSSGVLVPTTGDVTTIRFLCDLCLPNASFSHRIAVAAAAPIAAVVHLPLDGACTMLFPLAFTEYGTTIPVGSLNSRLIMRYASRLLHP